MLEDDFTHVIRKALKGLALSQGEASSRAGIRSAELDALLGGRFDPALARRLAPVLGLSPEALARHPEYRPDAPGADSLRRLELPFGEETVNAWLIRAGDRSLLVDTGFEPGSCLAALERLDLPLPELVLVTHGHRDHVGGIADFQGRGIPIAGAAHPGLRALAAGESLRLGPLRVTCLDLDGHFSPTLGFSIEGLSRPVLCVGDALFAGSIGGCADPAAYRLALSRLRECLSPLPGHTILLPGHGPATTLALEREHNPFWPAIDRASEA